MHKGNLRDDDPRRGGSPGGLDDPFPGLASEFAYGQALPPGLPEDGISRRRFLNLLSASAALALGTSCSRIDRGKIVPYTRRPEEIIPGVAVFYASTFQEGIHTHGVLVKTREGRPIHVEGNAEHPLSRGKTNLRAIADLLGLYDPDRLRQPVGNGSPATWEAAEAAFGAALQEARRSTRPVLLLTEALVSPTRKALIDDLRKALPSLRHAAWEPAAPQPEMLAARAAFGEWVPPRIRMDRAEVILSLQADFLGGDSDAPARIREFAGWRRISRPSDPMNRLWVLEGTMTLTGANADMRLQVRPSRVAALVFALARRLHEAHGIPLPAGLQPEDFKAFEPDALATAARTDPGLLHSLAADLGRARKSSLVLAGTSLPVEAHAACQLLNVMLGAEGHTIETAQAPPAPEFVTCAGLADILNQAARGEFAAAVFWGTNPAFSFPDTSLWKAAVSGIPARFRIGLYEDETALECPWRLPEHHWLESWGDFNPAADLLSLRQPVMGAIHNTRQGEDLLLAGLRSLGADAPSAYPDYLKARWRREVHQAGGPVPFESFWNAALHDGVVRRDAPARPPRALRANAVRDGMRAASLPVPGEPGDFELVLMPDAAVYDGRYANNGWLNELPNPVTKATWSNPILLSVADGSRLGIRDEDVVTLKAGGATVAVPVLLQPGQAPGTLGLAFGYGRLTGNVARNIGVNAYPMMDASASSPALRLGVTLAPTGRRLAVPRTQEHHRMAGRDPARSWTMAEYAAKGRERPESRQPAEEASLIPAPNFPGSKWSMVIDLSTCVGCSACVIACQSENNIAVVGPEQVRNGREMHWIRIDRYYEGDPQEPRVLHQPMPCQHCDDAPCEIVCPVNATTHSPDGINQMVYNRCVGTRYCSNNCPYKVRRFNFLDYTSMKKPPENLVYNPEVTVRPRGVMEKCTFCIQRIEDARMRAKVEGRPVRDGEVVPACAAACPADAIVFGDINDPGSRVASLSRQDRGYRVLVELGVKPSVTYLTDISNPAGGRGKG